MFRYIRKTFLRLFVNKYRNYNFDEMLNEVSCELVDIGFSEKSLSRNVYGCCNCKKCKATYYFHIYDMGGIEISLKYNHIDITLTGPLNRWGDGKTGSSGIVYKPQPYIKDGSLCEYILTAIYGLI